MANLKCYQEELERLKSVGRGLNLSEEEVCDLVDDSLRLLEAEQVRSAGRQRRCGWAVLLTAAAVLCLVYSNRKVAHDYLERNIQEVIYPGMKLVRKLMLPLVTNFPALTEWYDEACLVGNPYFQVSDIDCWPCQGVRSILNLTMSNLSNEQYHSGIPFVFKDDLLKRVTLTDVEVLYESRKVMFNRDAARAFDSRTGSVDRSEFLFSEAPLHKYPSAQLDTHLTWKLNRLEPTRAMRQLFGSLVQLPNYVAGATTEKFLLVDEQRSSTYQLPDTEGSNVFVVQGSGCRLLLLKPSPECQHLCHSVSILLPQHHVLWFSWWYWRAFSVPLALDMGCKDNISVIFMGSYY